VDLGRTRGVGTQATHPIPGPSLTGLLTGLGFPGFGSIHWRPQALATLGDERKRGVGTQATMKGVWAELRG